MTHAGDCGSGCQGSEPEFPHIRAELCTWMHYACTGADPRQLMPSSPTTCLGHHYRLSRWLTGGLGCGERQIHPGDVDVEPVHGSAPDCGKELGQSHGRDPDLGDDAPSPGLERKPCGSRRRCSKPCVRERQLGIGGALGTREVGMGRERVGKGLDRPSLRQAAPIAEKTAEDAGENPRPDFS